LPLGVFGVSAHKVASDRRIRAVSHSFVALCVVTGEREPVGRT
jgi:hypothetical protein